MLVTHDTPHILFSSSRDEDYSLLMTTITIVQCTIGREKREKRLSLSFHSIPSPLLFLSSSCMSNKSGWECPSDHLLLSSFTVCSTGKEGKEKTTLLISRFPSFSFLIVLYFSPIRLSRSERREKSNESRRKCNLIFFLNEMTAAVDSLSLSSRCELLQVKKRTISSTLWVIV